MKVGKVLGGLAVLGLFGVGVFAMKQNGMIPTLPFLDKPKPLVLKEGTLVPLVLADSLTSGGSKAGDGVTLYVQKDVKVEGHTVIPRGAKVKAEVTVSKAATETAAGELEIGFRGLELEGGKTVKVGLRSKKDYAFSKENTSGRESATKFERLWETPEGKKALEDVQREAKLGGLALFQSGSLKKVADAMGLTKTKELLESPRQEKERNPIQMLDSLVKGDVIDLAGFDRLLATEAMGEISSLLAAIDDRMNRVVQGKNILATMGTPVLVSVREDAEFPRPEKKDEKSK